MAIVEQLISSKTQDGIRTTHDDHIQMLKNEYARRLYPAQLAPLSNKELKRFYDQHPQILDGLQAQHHEQRLAKEERARNPRPSKSARAVRSAHCKSICSACSITVTEWLENLQADFSDYLHPCMYNVDELLFQFHIEGDVAMLVTIVLACNSDGTQRLPPILILMEKDRHELPLALTDDPFIVFTGSGCLDSDTFYNWIAMFGNFLHFLGQSGNLANILLTLNGNSPRRTKQNKKALAKLPNTSNLRFPPNQTRLVQPLDQGIIKDFRLRVNKMLSSYRRRHNEDPSFANVIAMIRKVWHTRIPIDVFVEAFRSSYKFGIRSPNY
ncbi:hypothetical protein GGI17_006317 [Coemansia sp. S146]|nr:hypothetical protein GGI17_006317 [Coemansia sp. S146]